MTIGIDFDGVLHAYSRGWQNGVIYDEPLPGAADGLAALMSRDAVFVLTARDDLNAVADWIEEHLGVKTLTHGCGRCTYGKVLNVMIGSEITHYECVACGVPGCSGPLKFWERLGTVLVTNMKLPAQTYVDDRAVRFTSWDGFTLYTPESADVSAGQVPEVTS